MNQQPSQLNQAKPEWWKSEFFDDYATRRSLAKTFTGFCLVYLSHYLDRAPASFHPELLLTLGNHDEKMVEIIGFRGSAKSTFGSLALPLWAALEYPDFYNFIIPIADTGTQASLNIANIKEELENNPLIKQDYGEIKGKFVVDWTLESEEEWQAKNMLLSNGVRILARSRGQKVRGLRHKQHRPKLVVVDDPEDLEWVRTKENRDKTERWLRGEVIPAIDETTGRLVVIGNQLHTDALMARLKRDKTFKQLEYPLVKKGKITWLAKYPDQKALDAQRDKVGLNAYQREYLLKVIPEEGADVHEEWLRYYDKVPPEIESGLHGTGVDLAISKKETADYTSMVSGVSFVRDGIPKIYIKPNPINARLSFHETIETTKAMAITNPFGIFFVEDVQYQRAAIEEMERALLPVVAMRAGSDKRARLRAIAVYVQNGTIVFPRKGCEDLIIQLLGFGVEEHDDLVDAFVYLILGLVQQGMQNPEVVGLI
jgi:predicted phage terminase large subunit-like protein